MPSRRTVLAALASAALPMAQAQTQTQSVSSWPSRPVRIVVAYPTGGLSDTVARQLAERLAGPLGQPVTVENRAGASGAIGLDAVAKSRDGHTLGFAAVSPLTLLPHLGKLPFDAQRDLLPVVAVMDSPVLLLATPASPARDLRELLAQARAKPGAVRWATSGPASLGHVLLEQLKTAAGVDITHIPYKGGGQQITDALGGQFEVLSVNAGPAVLGHVQAGRLRPLAVGAPARLEALPSVPTLAEAGFTAANLDSLFGLFAPAGTPEAVIARINREVNRLLDDPAIRGPLRTEGNIPAGGSAADFARRIAAESEATARIVRAAGIKAE